ncbi:MAG: prephenate dehydratase [Dehalococcoidia bacterium]
MRLAHLGPRGTYTEAAALAFDSAADLLPVSTVTTAVEAVEAGQADAAVCAIENAIDGGINETIDLLLREDGQLHVRGEVVLAIHHALVGPAGIDVHGATVVYSHPSALGQCRRRLAELAPNAKAVAALSTTAAIEASMAESGALAVGNRLSAELHHATIYAEDIADEPGNETRFVVLAHEDAPRTGDDKTSIAFTTHHDRPGSLVEVLGIFSRRGINLTRIESRPTRRALGTYVFLLDLQGHRDDEGVAEAVEEARKVTLWLRVLGSYPRWTRTLA